MATTPRLEILHDENLPSHLTVSHIFVIFERLVHGNSTPENTAEEINSLYSTRTGPPQDERTAYEKLKIPEKPENILWSLWEIFFDVIEQVPPTHSAHEKLFQFVKYLKSLSPHLGVNSLVDVWGTKLQLWTDLPFMRQIALEEWNSIASDPALGDEYYDSEQIRWASYNLLCARLTSEEIVDYTTYGLCEFKAVLEVSSSSSEFLDYRVPIVSRWVQHTARSLYMACKTPSAKDHVAIGTLDRWDRWKHRLEELSRFEGCSKETQELAKQATLRMEEAESEWSAHDTESEKRTVQD